jgi:hypothetical protein
MEDRLNALCSAKYKYEVINMGVPHLTSAMIRDLFVTEGLSLAPDVVTFYEGINDASTSPEALAQSALLNASQSRSRLMMRAYTLLIPIYRRIRDWSMFLLFVDNIVQVSNRSTPEQVAAYRKKDRMTKFLANVRAIRDATESTGAEFIAVSQLTNRSSSHARPCAV